MFEQALCEVLVSFLPDCIWEMDTESDCGTFPLPTIVKQEVCKSTFQAILIGHAKWEPVRLPEPYSVEWKLECWWGQILCAIALCGAYTRAYG